MRATSPMQNCLISSWRKIFPLERRGEVVILAHLGTFDLSFKYFALATVLKHCSALYFFHRLDIERNIMNRPFWIKIILEVNIVERYFSTRRPVCYFWIWFLWKIKKLYFSFRKSDRYSRFYLPTYFQVEAQQAKMNISLDDLLK